MSAVEEFAAGEGECRKCPAQHAMKSVMQEDARMTLRSHHEEPAEWLGPQTLDLH